MTKFEDTHQFFFAQKLSSPTTDDIDHLVSVGCGPLVVLDVPPNVKNVHPNVRTAIGLKKLNPWH